MKRKWIAAVLVLLILIGGGLLLRQAARNRMLEMQQNITQEMITKVERGTLNQIISGLGTLQPNQEKNLAFPSGGEVKKVAVSEGDRVESEQALVYLYDTQERLNYLRALNAYESIKIHGPASQVKEQELSLHLAEKNLEATVLRAPFPGLISQVNVEAGDFVSTGQALINIVDDSSYTVRINVEETDSMLLETGQKALITLDAFPNSEFPGRVERISFRTENNLVPVTIRLDERKDRFRPGFSAEVEIIVKTAEDALIVPITAVFTHEDKEYVVLKENEELIPTAVNTGMKSGIYLVITQGLTEGDQVLKNAYQFSGRENVNPLLMHQGPFR